MSIRQRQDFSQSLNFNTSTAGLKRRSLQSSLITFSSQPIKLMIGIGATLVLARLLTPADFGLVAMALPWFALLETVNSLGLGTATVQREHLDHWQASTVFWLSCAINLLLIGGVLLLAPVVARFYQESRLTMIVAVMAIGMTSVFLSSQHQSLLARQMRFGLLTLIEVGALGLGALAAIAAALMGWGYWALVIQLVVYQVGQGISCWVASGWRPARPTGLIQLSQDTRSMFAYGANLSGFNLLNRAGLEMDRILVGYFNGASALGLYAVAYNWAYFPFNQVYFPLINVAVSGLSRAAKDSEQYKIQSRQLLMLMFSLCLPALAFLGIAGKSFMLILLGDQWVDAFPIFRVLVLSIFVSGFYRVTKWLYLSTGQTQRQLRWSCLHTPLMMAAAALGTRWGPLGVAWGITIASLVLTYPAIAYCLRYTPLTMADFVGFVWRPTLASVAAAGLLFVGQTVGGGSVHGVFYLLISAIAFSFAYGAAFMLLPGGWQDVCGAYRDVRLLVSKHGEVS